MATVPAPKGQIIVDSRGRTNLGRVRSHDYDRYFAVEHESGTIVLTPVISMTPAELEELQEQARRVGQAAIDSHG